MKCILLICIALAVVNAQMPPYGGWPVNPWQGWQNIPRYNVNPNWSNQQQQQQQQQQQNQTQPQQQQKNQTQPQQQKGNNDRSFWYDVCAAEIDIVGEIMNHYSLGRIRLHN